MQKIITVGQTSNKGSQAGKVYSTDGIFPTVCACTHGYAIGNILVEEDMYLSNGAIRGIYNEKGKIEQKLELRNDGVTNTLTTVEKDNVIVENNKLKGGENMWKNELEKFEFKMEEIKLFDSFSGIGSLHKALKKLGIPVKLVGIAEVDIDAIIAYAAIHIENFKYLEFEYPSDDEMKDLLIKRDIGKDFKTGKSKITRIKKDKLKLVYKATMMLNNLGNVDNIGSSDIPDFDLFNISMPCQTFSMAGKRLGINDFRGTLGFTSLELLRKKQPKYFMIENVPGLISIDSGNVLKSLLEIACSCGYKIQQTN